MKEPLKRTLVLNAGYVELLDVMGNDETICDAARVSYADASKRTNDRNLIRYMWSNKHCYDDATEVLTSNGFKLWSDVTIHDKLGGWDENAKTLVYEIPRNLVAQPYEGRMYRVNHGGVDLLVTPNHKMYVSRRERGEWSPYHLREAESLGHLSMQRYTKIAPLRESDINASDYIPCGVDVPAFLQLLGFFVGDGHAGLSDKNAVRFHLKKRRKIRYITELANKLGFELRTHAANSYSIHFNELGTLMKAFCYSDEKHKQLPYWVLQLNQDEAIHVLDGLRNSDGSTKRKTWEYFTTYEKLAEQVQLLALHSGQAAHAYRNSKTTSMWRVMFLSRMHHPVINQGTKNTSFEYYNGTVYCAETRTGILVVRRNGKIVLSGNSSPFEQVVFQFRCKMPIFIARQWVRHRTARLNEISGRYSELPEEFYNYWEQGLPLQSQTNNQGSEVQRVEGEPGWLLAIENCNKDAFNLYHELLEAGVSKEIARCHLPLSTYTQWYWQMDLHNLLHFLELRMDAHAQAEIRVYANAIYDMIKEYVPHTIEAFEDYTLNGMKLSRMEVKAIKDMIEHAAGTYTTKEKNEKLNWGMSSREVEAFSKKLERIGY